MNTRQYNKLIAELRRSRKVVSGYSEAAFNKWVDNVLTPHIRARGATVYPYILRYYCSSI